jgi:hypothetical protein
MGYARLIYNNNTQSKNMLDDIAKIITGNITSKAQLTHFNPVTSEIVNSLGENWSYLSNGEFTKAFTAPCLDPSKTKFLLLRSRLGNNFEQSGTISATTTGNIVCQSAANITFNPNINLTGETWYNTTATTVNYGNSSVFIGSTSDSVFLSWSQRHFLIFSAKAGGSNVGFFLCTEFPENELSRFTGTAPVACLNYTTASGSTTELLSELTPSSTTSIGQCFINTLNQFVPRLTQTLPVYAHTFTGGSGTFPWTITANSLKLAPSVNNQGQTAYYFTPLWFASIKDGIPIINFSALSNVYITDELVGPTGTDVVVSGNTFVAVQLGHPIDTPTFIYGALMLLKQ